MHNTVINKDCLSGIKELEDNSVDMIVTSPPYFVGKDYNEGADFHNFNDVEREWKKFVNWLCEIFIESKRILKPSGKIAINIDDRHLGLKTFGKNVTLPTHAKLIDVLKDHFDYKEMILWRKIRGAKSSGGSNLMLGSYGRFGSPGEIPIIQEVEYILLFRKEGNREDIDDELRKRSALTPEEFSSYGMQIWDVGPEKNRVHPAPYPVEIPYRLIKLFSFKDDIIFDPFMGSGTTAIAALKAGRKFLGFEMNEDFYKECNRRIESYKENKQDYTYMKTSSIFSRKKDKKLKSSIIF